MITKLTRKLSLTAILSLMTVFCLLISARTAYAAVEAEPNNAYATATTVTIGNSCTGVIISSNDADYYKVVPSNDGYLTVTFSHASKISSAKWVFKLVKYGANYSPILSSTTVNLSDDATVTLPSAGVIAGETYFIVVTCYTGAADLASQNYTISTSMQVSPYYEKELNNEYSTATPMSIGQTYTGTIGNSNDIDYYIMTPSEDGYLTVTFNHPYQISSGNWVVNVVKYGANYSPILSSTTVYLSDDDSTVTLPSAGLVAGEKYLIKVSCNSGSADICGKDYNITTSLKASSYYEKELNNEYSTATPISINRAYTGNISASEDKDYYLVTPPKDGYLYVKFKHPTKVASSAWAISVYKYGTNSTYLCSKTVYMSDDATISLPKTGVTAGGKYMIVISKYTGSDVVGKDYSVTATFRCATHTCKTTKTKATLSDNGKIRKKCSVCGYTKTTTIYRPKTFTLSSTTYAYNGKVKTPTLTVKNSNGKVISASKYTVTKSTGRKKIGTYKYTITFKGNYSGTKTVSFKIVPKKASLSSVTVGKECMTVKASAKAAALYGSGYKIAYRKSGTTKWTSILTTYRSRKISGLTTGKKYQVRIRAYKKINGKYYYGSWSTVKTSSLVK